MTTAPTATSTSTNEIANAGNIARTGSILAVDFGNVHTRAVLIDLVDGVYQLVASGESRTTAAFPDGDVSVGLTRAAYTISQTTGRRLLDSSGHLITPEQPDRSGVDIVRFTASIGRPLRTVLMGLVSEISIATAMRAAAGTYVQVVETLSLDDQRTPQEQLNAIILARPDLIFITGGMEDGARQPVLDLAQMAKLALRFMDSSIKPPVLFAGNTALHEEIAAMFSGVTPVYFSDNARPKLSVERLDPVQLELAVVYDSFASSRGLGFETVSAQSDTPVIPTAQSYDIITEYLGRSLRLENRRAGGVIIADIGSAVSTLSASIGGRVTTSIRTDIGVGHSAKTLLDSVGINAVRGWLPFVADDNEITAYALNKTLHAAYVPDTHRSLFLEHALLRTAFRSLLLASRPAWTPDTALDSANELMPPVHQIIGAGSSITRTGRAGMSAMLMLDAVQPTGIVRLQADDGALIPALGSLARTSPEAVVQVLEAVGLEDLCTCVNLSGTPRVGRRAARVKVTLYHSDGSTETEKFNVFGGDLWVYPLALGAKATIRINVVGRGLHAGGSRRLKLEVEGGTAGFIIDARGRPLPLPKVMRARAATLARWYAQATGDEMIEIPEAWLQEVKAESARAPRQTRAERRELERAGTSNRLRDLEAEASAKSAPPKRGRRVKTEPEVVPPFDEPVPPAGEKKDDDFDELRNLFS